MSIQIFWEKALWQRNTILSSYVELFTLRTLSLLFGQLCSGIWKYPAKLNFHRPNKESCECALQCIVFQALEIYFSCWFSHRFQSIQPGTRNNCFGLLCVAMHYMSNFWVTLSQEDISSFGWICFVQPGLLPCFLDIYAPSLSRCTWCWPHVWNISRTQNP